jgi:predicted ATP-dependent serine protease
MLDQLVGGGLAEGTSCLFVGPSGAGKSSVAALYACAAAERGERSAVFLFVERPETFIRRSESLGMPVRSHIESELMLIRPINTAELSPGEFAERVRQQVQERGVRVVTMGRVDQSVHVAEWTPVHIETYRTGSRSCESLLRPPEESSAPSSSIPPPRVASD